MGDSPLTILSDASSPASGGTLFCPESYSHSDTLAFLRRAVSDADQNPASVLQACAETARVLCDADGVAIALKTDGAVVCRARGGDLAPELGVPIEVEKGFSGECIRSAHTLVCSDAENDPRVDAQVCSAFGIRSILGVPVRGRNGIVGILEAFSARPTAFGPAQVDVFVELSEIVETAYERELLTNAPVAQPDRRKQLFSALAGEKSFAGDLLDRPSRKRTYWITSLVVVAILLISAVLWLGWHDPTPELAASEVPGDSLGDLSGDVTAPPKTPKPEAGISNRRVNNVPSDGKLQNAAKIEKLETASVTADSPLPEPAPIATTNKASNDATSAIDAPPSIEVVKVDPARGGIPLPAAPVSLPVLSAKISQGLTESVLLHQVNPAYPSQARLQRMQGAVVLDATIGPDGKVKNIQTISGPALLVAAAKDAVHQWRYTPSKLNGTPIEVQKRITVDFKLP